MEDISNIIQELSNVFSNNDIPDNLKEVINNFANSSKENNSNDNINSSANSENNNNNFNIDIDIDMILKIKKIMEGMSNNNDPRKSLLLSLKPYLKDEKKEKIDQYVKFLGLAKIIQIIGPEFLGSDKNG